MKVSLYNPTNHAIVLGDPFQHLAMLRSGQTVETEAPDDILEAREWFYSPLTDDELPQETDPGKYHYVAIQQRLGMLVLTIL